MVASAMPGVNSAPRASKPTKSSPPGTTFTGILRRPCANCAESIVRLVAFSHSTGAARLTRMAMRTSPLNFGSRGSMASVTEYSIGVAVSPRRKAGGSGAACATLVAAINHSHGMRIGAARILKSRHLFREDRMRKVFGLLALAAFAAHAQTPPPAFPARNVPATFFGTVVDDPYRDLEDVAKPEVAAWAKSQADFARGQLDSLPGYKA